MTTSIELDNAVELLNRAGNSGGDLLYVNTKTGELKTVGKWSLIDRLFLSGDFTTDVKQVAARIDALFTNFQDDTQNTFSFEFLNSKKERYEGALEKFKKRISKVDKTRESLFSGTVRRLTWAREQFNSLPRSPSLSSVSSSSSSLVIPGVEIRQVRWPVIPSPTLNGRSSSSSPVSDKTLTSRISPPLLTLDMYVPSDAERMRRKNELARSEREDALVSIGNETTMPSPFTLNIVENHYEPKEDPKPVTKDLEGRLIEVTNNEEGFSTRMEANFSEQLLVGHRTKMKDYFPKPHLE